MPKKKLIIEAGSLAEKNMSGVGHTTLHLVRALATDGSFAEEFEIQLIVPFNKVEIAKKHSLPDTIRICKLFLPGKIMNGLSRFGLIPYMDIFFGKGVYLFPNFKNWPLLFSKNITYIHDVYFKVRPDHIEQRNLSMLERGVEKFIERASLVVGVSQHAKSEIERFFPLAEGKTDFVYNGVDHDLFYRRDAAEQEVVTAIYGLVPQRYFMFLSNIEPRKNVAGLLGAYKEYIDTTGNKDVGLLLVGGMGWGNEEIIARMQQLQDDGYKVVKPSSYVPDEHLPALLSGAKALLHPALYEGFGLTPLEAMACGIPIVIGKNSSLPEIVGAEFDQYVAVTNVHKMAEVMIHIDHYPKKEIEYGVKRAGEFTWKKSAEKLARLIRSL